jgi:DNA-directed RNA polymerase subunit K/omega
MVEYLEFIEEYKDQTALNLFDKVKVIAARTRDIYDGKASKAIADADLEHRKPSTIAHYEVIHGYIVPDIHEKEEKKEDYMDDLEIE